VSHPIVLAPFDLLGDVPAEGAAIAPYRSAEEVIAALRGDFTGAVLLSDALADDELAAVANAVRTSGRPVIEVRSASWDGVTHSPLSAACRGIVAGFGLAGVREALRALA
jgi:3-dehydroquinate dehydratase